MQFNVDPRIPVLLRFARSYPAHVGCPMCGDPKCVERGPLGPADEVVYRPLSSALATPSKHDVHFAAYSHPSVTRRLAGAGSHALAPEMVLFVVDVDAPDHKFTDEWWQAERPKLARLLAPDACPGAHVYTTRGGYRIIWIFATGRLRIDSHQAARKWSASCASWLGHLETTYQIVGDRACGDWTRLFRLPRATRDGVEQVPQTMGADPDAIGPWRLPFVEPPAEEIREIVAPPDDAELPSDDAMIEAAQVLAEAWRGLQRRGRHHASLYLCGALANAGWPESSIAEFVSTVAELEEPGNGDYSKRLDQARDSVSKAQAGDPVGGIGKLREHGLDPDAINRAVILLGIGIAPDEDFRDAFLSDLSPSEQIRREFADVDTATMPVIEAPRVPDAPGVDDLPAEDRWRAHARAAAEAVAARVGDEDGDAPRRSGRNAPAFMTGRRLMATLVPPTPWLVEGLVPLGAITAIATEPKSAKTWFAMEIAMAAATGTPAFGKYMIGEGAHWIAYFFAEDQIPSIQARLRALAASRSMSIEQATARMLISPRGNTMDLTNPRDLAWIVASARVMIPDGERLSGLVLDPLRDLHTAEEDKADAMAPVMRNLRTLSDLLGGCAIPFVHHSAKASDSNRGRRPGQRMRGSSAIHGSVDAGIYLSDLETNNEDEFTNTVTSEIKGAKGAGTFRMRLKIDDDAKTRMAVRATWTWSEFKAADRAIVKQGGDPATTRDDKRWEMIKLLSRGTPMSQNELKKKLGGKSEIWAEVIAAAIAAGLVIRPAPGGPIRLTDEGFEEFRGGSHVTYQANDVPPPPGVNMDTSSLDKFGETTD